MFKPTYLLAALCTFSPMNLLAMESTIAFFGTEAIKKAISSDPVNGPAIMRSAFPEEVWLLEQKRDKPSKCFGALTPLKSLYEINMAFAHYDRRFALGNLEKKWIKLHRKLHELIANTLILSAIETLKPSEIDLKEWQTQYIEFFFAPLSNASRNTDPLSSGYSHHHYTDQSAQCPTWLKENLNKYRIEGKFGDIYDELKEINLNIGELNTIEYLKARAEIQLKSHNYFESLEAFAQRFLLLIPSTYKINITHRALALAIGGLIVEKPDIQDLYVHISFAEYILDKKEQFYYHTQKHNCYIFPKTRVYFKFDALAEEINKYLSTDPS